MPNTILASATHTGGELRHLFHYFFRAFPQFWRHVGLEWDNVEQAVDLYGFTQDVTKEHVSEARSNSGQIERKTTRIEVPGMSPHLLPMVLQHAAFIGIIDVGASMPMLEEIPVLVSMKDPLLTARVEAAKAHLQHEREMLETARDWANPAQLAEYVSRVDNAELAVQEAVSLWIDCNLEGKYKSSDQYLRDEAMSGNSAAMLAKGNLPGAFAVAGMIEPAFSVEISKKNVWGRVTGRETFFTFPTLSPNWTYPLERELLTIVENERSQHRRVMVYYYQNRKHDVGARLVRLLADAGHKVWRLPDMDGEQREQAIKSAVENGFEVVVVPYTQVVEGLNLQHHLDTIIWYELAQSHFARDQASRRIYRLGKTFPDQVAEEHRNVRIYYLAYEQTTAHKKLDRLGKQNGAAMLFAGEPPTGALVEVSGADQTALAKLSGAVASALGEDNDEDNDEWTGACARSRAAGRAGCSGRLLRHS